MAELIIDEDNILTDLTTTLFGTKLVEFYGERTHQTLKSTDSPNSLKSQMKATHERTIASVSEMLKQNTPMYSHIEYLEEDKNYVTATGLILPMRKKSETTNMVLGYVEVSYRES